MQTDEEPHDPNMEPVYNVNILENHGNNDIIVEDSDSVWPAMDPRKETCASLTFHVPQQQLSRFLQKPVEHLLCLIAAAEKSRNEVTYSELSKGEQEMFQAAKRKELKCWLDTNTVKAIARDRIHFSKNLSFTLDTYTEGGPTVSNRPKGQGSSRSEGIPRPTHWCFELRQSNPCQKFTHASPSSHSQ